MARPRQLWQHGNMRGARAGNQDHLWTEAEIRRRQRGESRQAKRERERAERAAARRAKK
jgi:hypothetical protein